MLSDSMLWVQPPRESLNVHHGLTELSQIVLVTVTGLMMATNLACLFWEEQLVGVEIARIC